MENIDFEQLIAHSDGNEEYITQLVEIMKKQLDTVDEDRR